MTDEQLQAIKQREQAATKGPWTEGVGKVRNGETRELIIGADGRTIVAMAYGGFGHPTPDCTTEDRRFIAAAREDVPALLAEVERLRKHSECLRYVLADINVDDFMGTREAALAGGEAFEEVIVNLLAERDRGR